MNILEPDQLNPTTTTNTDADTFRILICTDNHLGFNSSDPIRHSDSFRAFEECLQMAQIEKVDFILLGGDLFHVRKPNLKTYIQTSELLSRYCLGPRSREFSLDNKSEHNLFSRTNTPNFENPKVNVSIPTFIVHGNHDEPGGIDMLSPLDGLASSHLLNYFGSCGNADNIEIRPLRLRKGTTKLALYGIGNIRDERLYHSFRKKKVKIRPPSDAHSWFNLMVIHQNRYKHSINGMDHIPETSLSWKTRDGKPILDFVLWAHEHESLPDLHFIDNPGLHILQAGSTTPTSLSEAESRTKHCFLLTVKGKQFKCKPIPLKNTRPFISRVFHLAKAEPAISVESTTDVLNFIITSIEETIVTAIEDFNEMTNSNIPSPTQEIFDEIRSNLLDDYTVHADEDDEDFHPASSSRGSRSARAKKLASKRKKATSKKTKKKQPHLGELEDFLQNPNDSLEKGQKPSDSGSDNNMKRKKNNSWTLDVNQLPLIRLKIDVTGGYSIPSLSRITRAYTSLVANPSTMITQFQKTARWTDLDMHEDETGISDNLTESNNPDVCEPGNEPVDASISMKAKIDQALSGHNFKLFRKQEFDAILDEFITQGDTTIFKRELSKRRDDVISTVTSRLEEIYQQKVSRGETVDLLNDPIFNPEIYIESYRDEREREATTRMPEDQTRDQPPANTPLEEDEIEAPSINRTERVVVDDDDLGIFDSHLTANNDENENERQNEPSTSRSKKKTARRKRPRDIVAVAPEPKVKSEPKRKTKAKSKPKRKGKARSKTPPPLISFVDDSDSDSEIVSSSSSTNQPSIFEAGKQLSQDSVFSFVSQHTAATRSSRRRRGKKTKAE